MAGAMLRLSPNVHEGLEDRIRWINEVTELAVAEDWREVAKAIDEIDPRHLRVVTHVLIMARAGDLCKLRALGARVERARLN